MRLRSNILFERRLTYHNENSEDVILLLHFESRQLYGL